MVEPLLTCFHGPQVESAFSLMGGIIDKKTASVSIDTLNAVQTVKYNLHAEQKTAIQYFRKQDHMYDPINPRLCINMSGASKCYRTELQRLREEQAKKIKTLKVQAIKQKTKKQELALAALSKKSRMQRVKRLQQRKNQVTAKSTKGKQPTAHRHI